MSRLNHFGATRDMRNFVFTFIIFLLHFKYFHATISLQIKTNLDSYICARHHIAHIQAILPEIHICLAGLL